MSGHTKHIVDVVMECISDHPPEDVMTQALVHQLSCEDLNKVETLVIDELSHCLMWAFIEDGRYDIPVGYTQEVVVIGKSGDAEGSLAQNQNVGTLV
jgi:hypothetical protein